MLFNKVQGGQSAALERLSGRTEGPRPDLAVLYQLVFSGVFQSGLGLCGKQLSFRVVG